MTEKKLIIQIPCYNEEETLPLTLADLPRQVDGFDKVEWLIINDGSTDNTVKVAKENGVDHVVSFSKNKGLAHGFMAGIEKCIELGANVIVNADADNQYSAFDIPKLTRPVLEGHADMVVGARPISQIKHFSFSKKILQKLGSFVVRFVSKTDVVDAPSGFRAISREAALRFNVFNNYTYTLETIVQAGRSDMSVISVPISVNEDLRPSRLFKSISSYIKKSIIVIFRIFIIYKPFRFFISLAITLFILGLIPAIRFLYYFLNGYGGHIQSLILSAILLIMSAQIAVLAFIGDLLSVNRSILEDIQYKIRKEKNGGRF